MFPVFFRPEPFVPLSGRHDGDKISKKTGRGVRPRFRKVVMVAAGSRAQTCARLNRARLRRGLPARPAVERLRRNRRGQEQTALFRPDGATGPLPADAGREQRGVHCTIRVSARHKVLGNRYRARGSTFLALFSARGSFGCQSWCSVQTWTSSVDTKNARNAAFCEQLFLSAFCG